MWFFLGFACVLFTFAMGIFFALFVQLMITQAVRYERLARELRNLKKKPPMATTIDDPPSKSVQVEVVHGNQS